MCAVCREHGRLQHQEPSFGAVDSHNSASVKDIKSWCLVTTFPVNSRRQKSILPEDPECKCLRLSSSILVSTHRHNDNFVPQARVGAVVYKYKRLRKRNAAAEQRQTLYTRRSAILGRKMENSRQPEEMRMVFSLTYHDSFLHIPPNESVTGAIAAIPATTPPIGTVCTKSCRVRSIAAVGSVLMSALMAAEIAQAAILRISAERRLLSRML